MSDSEASEEGGPESLNPVNTDDRVATVPVPRVQHLLPDSHRENEPPESSGFRARHSSSKVSDCIFCGRLRYKRQKHNGVRRPEKVVTNRPDCQGLLRAAVFHKDERILARLQGRNTNRSAHNAKDTSIKYHHSCYKEYTRVLDKSAASNADGGGRIFAKSFDKFCSTVIEARIISGHENMTVEDLKELFVKIAKEEENIDLSHYRRYQLRDRLKGRYPKEIKFVNVKKGYPEVVVNASDHTIKPDILKGIKWNKKDLQELTLAEPAQAGTRENRTGEPGSIHTDLDAGDEGDDFSPSSPTAVATQLSGGDGGVNWVSQEVEAGRMAVREETCHLTVNRAVYDRWCSIRTAEGLETDTDVAQLFIRQYEETKTQRESISLCASCNTSLQLFCPTCESPSPVASEGQELVTETQREEADPMKRGRGRPRARRGETDRAVESGMVVCVSVAERVGGTPRERGTADCKAEDSDKIVVESVAVPSKESDCDQFRVGDEGEKDLDSDMDGDCHSEHLHYLRDEVQEVAKSCVKLKEHDNCGTNTDRHLEVCLLASNPVRGDHLPPKRDYAMQSVAGNCLWSVEDGPTLFREDSSALSQKDNSVLFEDNSVLSKEDDSALHSEDSSALSEEGNALQCGEDNCVQSRGDSATQARRNSPIQCEEAKYTHATEDSIMQSATSTDEHEPLKGAHVDLCLVQPSPCLSVPQRKTRSSSCVPACYFVPQQQAVKSAAENRKQKRKTLIKCDSDSDSDWDPSESEPSYRKKKKRCKTHHACKFCLQIFRTLQEFKKHLDTHKLQTKCDHCDSVFDDKTSYFEHVKQHKGGMPFSCDLCSLCFMSSEDRDRHKEAHTCRQCGKVYKSLQALKSHMQCHINGKKPFKCDSCGKGFFFEATLRRHLSACGNRERRYICEICAKAFKNGAALRAHIKTHSDEKPFACTLCSARLKSKDSLNAHMKRHRGERPCVCEQCGRAYTDVSKLNQHKVSVHCKERPHQCRMCGYASAFLSSLRIHIRRRHSFEKPFKCKSCHLAFSERHDLVSHTRTHTGEKPYSCKLCNATFARRDYLSKHMAIHTGNTRFMCSLCGVGFRHYIGLKRHSPSHCSAAQK